MTMVRDIVNGAGLQAFANKKVSLIGHVENKAPNGMNFNVRTTDNQIVKITLKRPVDQPIEGYVEVHGTSTGQGITADEFIVFANSTFDANGYNKLCSLLRSVPNLWNVS